MFGSHRLAKEAPIRFAHLSVIRRLALSFGLFYLAATVIGMTALFGGTLGQEPRWVFGVAPVNLAHNVLHAAIGLLGILSSARNGASRAYLRVLGLLLIGLGILGLINPNPFGALPIGGVDFLLHILSGGVALYYGFAPDEDVF